MSQELAKFPYTIVLSLLMGTLRQKLALKGDQNSKIVDTLLEQKKLMSNLMKRGLIDEGYLEPVHVMISHYNNKYY